MLVAAILLIVAAGLIYAQYRSDLSTARRDLQAGSHISHTACGPVEYAVAGSGPAVLVIHGAGGGYSQVAVISAWLAASGFKTIAMSRFGYLRTPLPEDVSSAAQADAHACLLDALGVSKAAALGLSAGAPSAVQYCLRHPTSYFISVVKLSGNRLETWHRWLRVISRPAALGGIGRERSFDHPVGAQ